MPNKKGPIERFWLAVKKTKTCWIWTKGAFSGGYGCLPINGGSRMAHRFSWEIHEGPIPNGLFVCHKCDNPSCVRPSHLFLGTPKDNMIDKAKKNRQYRPTGTLHHHAKLTEKDVKEIRRLYAAKVATLMELSKKYGVGKPAICSICKNQKWKHI